MDGIQWTDLNNEWIKVNGKNLLNGFAIYYPKSLIK